jgi:hypothetical protein
VDIHFQTIQTALQFQQQYRWCTLQYFHHDLHSNRPTLISLD